MFDKLSRSKKHILSKLEGSCLPDWSNIKKDYNLETISSLLRRGLDILKENDCDHKSIRRDTLKKGVTKKEQTLAIIEHTICLKMKYKICLIFVKCLMMGSKTHSH